MLRARLKVAERILALEDRLAEQNRHLLDSRDRLEAAYGRIQKDLAAAAEIQRRMLPLADDPIAPVRAGWLYLPAAKVSGDNFNFFALGGSSIGFYLLDVSGHGIPAALLSASLSRSLVPWNAPGAAGAETFTDPAGLLAYLNQQLLGNGDEVEHYATLVYGTLDHQSGEVRIGVAGHPSPVILRTPDTTEYLTGGGLPVGMFAEAQYASTRTLLHAGDKLVLYSDGVTDCASRTGERFGGERLRAFLEDWRHTPPADITEALGRTLKEWRGTRPLEDDVSVLVLEQPATPEAEAQR